MSFCSRRIGRRLFLVAFALAFATAHAARTSERPTSFDHPIRTRTTPSLVLPAVDAARELATDARAMNAALAADGAVEKRLRVAVGNRVDATAARDGSWETLPGGDRLWRLTVQSPNATDLRFGFSRFRVPQGVTLHVIDEASRAYDGAYTSADTTPDGQLWLAPVSGDTLTLELHVPAGIVLAGDAVVLSSVGAGYRNVNARGGPGLFGAGESGTCNIDVVCPLGDDYRDEIRAVAKFYFQSGGTYLCTGTLVNNTAQDLKPYFLTANHCISTQPEATSMSLIWNYESPGCGQHGGGSTAQTQNGGATLRSHRADVDVALVELNSLPPTAYGVFYAGWDASGVAPAGSIGIHHPSGWVKAITEDDNGLTTMNSCIGSGGSSSHWRTGEPYAQGTTEGGSSGSAIVVPFGDASGHQNLIIGTLSGGSAACSGSVPNSGYDCYGKFSVAWDGSSASTRLRDWLDPQASGATTLPGIDPTGDSIFSDGFDGG
jgi:lysyl endopeptidase